jgi:Photosynthetic reaction centre cytochrome C subunit
LKSIAFTPSAAAIALLTAALFGASTIAQTPQTPATPEAGAEHPMHAPPAPTNLQVLPKDLTGEQVHQIMEKWAGDLGTHCSTCHAPNPNEPPSANGRQRLDFALDTKPEKKTARLMYTMVQDIKTNYMSKIDNAGIQVSCGTCHRGHLSPPPFFPPVQHPMAPPPGGAAPAAEPPAAPPAR